MIHRYLRMMMMITKGSIPLLKDPQTWNRTMITIALGYDITSYAKLKFEYYILDEETGDDTQPSVDDDQMLIQLKFNF